MIKTLVNRAKNPIATFVFAHGAGAGLNSEFMQLMAEGIAKHNIDVLRFDFAYMQLAEESGKRRPPDRADKLIAHFNEVLSQLDKAPSIFVGGKSMGGRMASMLLQESNALGCICMGYPFHPPSKPERLRIGHLTEISKPVLILQGERDTFGTREEISTYDLSAQVYVKYLRDGDHSFIPRRTSGVSFGDNLDIAVTQTVEFIKSNLGK